MRRYLRGRMARWIRRRQGPDTLPVTLRRRRLYIVPTRAGLGFGVVLLLMLIAGLNYANSSALFLTFALMGFVLVSMHQCHRNLLGITLSAVVAEPAFARSHGILTLTFDNPEPDARYRIAAGIDHGPALSTDMAARGRARLALPVPAPRRGIVRVERLLLITTHPFGLFQTWTWVHAAIELLVYPYPHGSLPMPAYGGDLPGVRSHTNTGHDEWLGLRPFRDGDSPRQVDWKAYAREAPLLVKEYSVTTSQLRVFDFDSLRNLPLETRLEQLSRWVVDAESSGERYGLVLPGKSIAPDRGPVHRHRCLAALALFSPEGTWQA